MKNPSQNKGKTLIVIGICTLAIAGILLHMHLDFAAGLGLGMGTSSILIGLKVLRN